MATQKVEARRLLLRIVKRRARPGTGSNLRLLMQGEPRLKVPNLLTVLAGLPWAAVGAIAARSYMPERSTLDLDIGVLRSDMDKVGERLRRAGFKYKGPLSIGGRSWVARDGSPVDVIELRQPWAEQALKEARQSARGRAMPVVPLAYLVLMKFEAGRLQDMADISRMLARADTKQLATVRRLFRRFNPDGLADLESVISLGRLELERGQTDE